MTEPKEKKIKVSEEEEEPKICCRTSPLLYPMMEHLDVPHQIQNHDDLFKAVGLPPVNPFMVFGNSSDGFVSPVRVPNADGTLTSVMVPEEDLVSELRRRLLFISPVLCTPRTLVDNVHIRTRLRETQKKLDAAYEKMGDLEKEDRQFDCPVKAVEALLERRASDTVTMLTRDKHNMVDALDRTLPMNVTQIVLTAVIEDAVQVMLAGSKVVERHNGVYDFCEIVNVVTENRF